jgi:hypothetical protein
MVLITLGAYGEAGAVDPVCCGRPGQESIGTLDDILDGIAWSVA